MTRTVDVSTPLQVCRELALEVLRTQPARVVTAADHPAPGSPLRVDLRVDAQGRGVHQHVAVEVDGLREAEGEAWMPIRWRPIGGEHLLPAFVGVLELREDEEGRAVLTLHGEYEAPLGTVGRFGDAVVGRRIAQRSLSQLVGRMAERIDDLAERSSPTGGWRPAPYPWSLRDSDASNDGGSR